jgi:hypothetical protein
VRPALGPAEAREARRRAAFRRAFRTGLRQAAPWIAALAVLLLLAACGAPEPAPLPRITGWAPQGGEVALDAEAQVELSAPAGPAGVLDATRVALARATDAKAVAAAVARDGGLGPGDPVIPCEIALVEGGRRIVLTPRAPLSPGLAHVVVVGPLHDADGHPILDPDGRRRTFLGPFRTVALPPGPPPVPVLTEARAVAASPAAGGEYAEVQDRGAGPLNLDGWRLEKRGASGAFSGCLLSLAEGGPVPPGGFALLTGAGWDRRYAVPPGTPRYACAGATLAGGLADDRPVDLRLLDPAGLVRTTLGAAGAPRCPAALERLDPAGPDAPGNLGCTEGEGTPGW